MGSALARAEPVPDIVSIDSLPVGSPLPRLVRGGWPRPRPTLAERHAFPVPQILLGGEGFDPWFEGRSKAFRKNFRSDNRKLLAAGFEYRSSIDAKDVVDRLPDFRRLYESRRASRGGAGPAFDDPFMAVVVEAAERLSGTGRFRLATIERPGEVIAADLIVSAGGQASAWFGGFDETWSQLSPSFECIVLSVQHAAQVGDTVYDLGAGGESYKYQFTHDEAMFRGTLLARRGLRPFHSPAQLFPYRARQHMARVLGRMGRSPAPG
jgi:CelD/BcsL family acetyltransferase involved in cellulose biosynthesis